MNATSFTVYGRTYRVWYDRMVRLWMHCEVDASGSQVGDAGSAPTRDLAILYLGMGAHSTMVSA